MTPLAIPKSVLEEARAFFEQQGSQGCEGTAMICQSSGGAVRLVIPRQTATPAPFCSVEVSEEGKLDLELALASDELYISRIHSHPELAFHSPTDNANRIITHEGALSIVVPFFGLALRRGLDACAVFRFDDHKWDELEPGRSRSLWVVEGS